MLQAHIFLQTKALGFNEDYLVMVDDVKHITSQLICIPIAVLHCIINMCFGALHCANERKKINFGSWLYNFPSMPTLLLIITTTSPLSGNSENQVFSASLTKPLATFLMAFLNSSQIDEHGNWCLKG